MGFADLHMHTVYSWDGVSTVSAVLKQVVQHTQLDVIAITDHDEVNGALEALELAPRYDLEVIPGSEISTQDGHLLALFISERIQPGLPLQETVLKVGEQGGVCIAPHPSARGANSLSPAVIRQALQDPDVARILLGIEVFNGGIFHQGGNRVAQALANDLPVAQVGNSDAHLLWMIGSSASEFPGRTAADLRRALKERTTRPAIGKASNPLRMGAGWLWRRLLIRAGWVAWNPAPAIPCFSAVWRRRKSAGPSCIRGIDSLNLNASPGGRFIRENN